MTIQNKSVAIEVDAATREVLGKASHALSELAGAYIHKCDSAPKGSRGGPRKLG